MIEDEKMSELQILVNADDFGRHELINKAVAEGVEKGFLRSATLMPGGKAFEDAVEVARSHPSLGVGIHLTLVNGFPVCDPKDIPSLVTKDGVFLDDYVAFVKHFLTGKVDMADVRRELSAQAAKTEKTGLALTHVDSHQHMHMLPGIIDIALDVAEGIHLDATRISYTPLFTGFSGNPGATGGTAGAFHAGRNCGMVGSPPPFPHARSFRRHCSRGSGERRTFQKYREPSEARHYGSDDASRGG